MSTIELENSVFELIENDTGHALASTTMVFDSSREPYSATFSGPNTRFGQALVSGDRMLYQSIDFEGKLSAGEATIELTQTDSSRIMVLNWRWLTGDHSNGVSRWRQIDT